MANQYDTNLKLQAIADAITGSGGVTPSLANLAKDTTLQATNTALGLLAKDNTAQATNTALGLLTKDTTLQATNTALGLLASDNSLQAIADDLETGSDLITALGAIATAITQGGGGGGTTNYNDLSNKPSINSTTLSGNKTGAELGLAGTADISNINITGSTNTTGSTIGKGVTFYLNGSLCVALANIAAGATFTSGTNYSTITIGEELSALNSKIVQQDKVSVTADGVKTYRQLFNELYGLIDRSKLTNRSVLWFKYTNGTIQYYNLGENAATWYCFTMPMAGSAGAKATTFIIASTQNACEYSASVGSTRTDYSTYVPQATTVFEVHY